MDPELESKLIKCLEGLEAGVSLPTLLLRYPAEAAQLRPMLETAIKLGAIKVAYPVAAEAASRHLFLEKAAEMRDGGRATRPGQIPFWRRFMFALASFLLFFIVGGTVIGGLATNALPGDWLYPMKLGLENSRLSLTRDPSERAIIEHQIEEERLAEVYQMLATGREGRIEYTTIITQITASEIKVHDLSVQITKETIVEGEPKAGSLVHLVCDVRSGRVFAVKLRVLSSPPPVAPTNTVTATPVPILSTTSLPLTNTATATPTPALPTTSPSPTHTQSPVPTPSPKPTLTSSPPSPPTLDPTDDNSGSSNASQTPEATDQPDDDETPEPTDEPDEDETPGSTDEPDEDETPEPTDEPDDDD